MLFDIDKYIEICAGCNRTPYMDKIVEANNEELKLFRKAVVTHKKGPQPRTFATAITSQGHKTFSPHEELITVIDWQLTKRSKKSLFFFNLFFPIRKLWIGFWYGMDCSRNEKYCGIHCVGRKSGKNLVEFIGFRQYLINLMKIIWRYIVAHHRWLIGALIAAIIGFGNLYLNWQTKNTHEKKTSMSLWSKH